MSDEGLITLKEAAKISGYAPDYIGQLIRAGKIPGKQVYCNIAWMTTAEAVIAYKNKGGQADKTKTKDFILSQKRKIGLQLNILKLFMRNFKPAWPILAAIILSFVLLNIYLFYFWQKNNSMKADSKNTPKELIF